MLNGLIITSFICWIAGFFINGFTLYNVLLIIPTIMFALRKFGIHIELSKILAPEILFLFFSTAWKLLFKKYLFVPWLIAVVVRLIFLGLVIYDDTMYVYVQEEKRHD